MVLAPFTQKSEYALNPGWVVGITENQKCFPRPPLEPRFPGYYQRLRAFRASWLRLLANLCFEASYLEPLIEAKPFGMNITRRPPQGLLV